MQTTLELEEQSGSPLGSDPCSVRALSLWRPWADWVILGWKPIETRLHQRFRCLGERPTLLAIHASAKWDKTAIEAARQWLTEDQIRLTETIIRQHPVEGHVIGTVMVMAFGPLREKDEARALIECRSVQRYGLILTEPTPLVPPLKTRGMQGLFRVQIPSQNVKEHATLSARARVDHGVEVEVTKEHLNRAADRGCCVSACSA